jgi:hypothetical protein
MANEYCCFLERDAVRFGRQITTSLMKVLLNILLADGAGSASLRKYGKGKGKSTPLEAWTGTWGSRRTRPSEFLDNRHIKVVSPKHRSP